MHQFCHPRKSVTTLVIHFSSLLSHLMENHKELQLIPTHLSHKPSSTYLSSWAGPSGSSRSSESEPFDTSSLDLQLSISLQPLRPPPECVMARPLREYGERNIDIRCIEALKWQAAEQFRLATIEKAYAEQVRELTRREMELAHSEFARARHIWEKAQEEVEKAERLKARATRRSNSACVEITCQACRRNFQP